MIKDAGLTAVFPLAHSRSMMGSIASNISNLREVVLELYMMLLTSDTVSSDMIFELGRS